MELSNKSLAAPLRDGHEPQNKLHLAPQPPAWYAKTYADDQLTGGHIIKLGVATTKLPMKP